MKHFNFKPISRDTWGLIIVSILISFHSSGQISSSLQPGQNLVCNPPVSQASSIFFSFVNQHAIRLHWINGSGNKRIVKMSQSNNFISPTNGDDPPANSSYVGTGEQVIYNGSDTTILVTGLAPATNYCFRIYEAECSGSSIVYATDPAVNNPNCKNTSPGCVDYIFTGAGNWSDAANWYLGAIPPTILPACSGITINPSGINVCILNVPQVISPNASMSIIPGKSLLILGDLVITPPAPVPCPSFTITHNGGIVAPVTKTIPYGTVLTNLTGTIKCWITQNLGANDQAIAASDASEASAGWYWQFNKAQGYKHDGTNRTPNTTWITNISEPSGWMASNDPCRLLINSSWRIPTNSEWVTADGAWDSYDDSYSSVLKLHAAGSINNNDVLIDRGIIGHYWSTDLIAPSRGLSLYLGSAFSQVNMYTAFKANAYTLRCIRD